LWANLDSDTQNMLLSKGVYNNNGEYVLWSNSSNKLSFELYNGANYELAHTTSTITSYENEWIHIGVTYNGVGGSSANAGIKIYINGVSQALTLGDNGSYTAMPNTTSNLHIGNYNNLQYKADGELSQLGIWKGALTQAQIQSVMESTSYSKIPTDVKSKLSSELFTSVGNTTGWSYDSSAETLTASSTSATAYTNVLSGVSEGDLVKLSFDVTGHTGGSVYISCGGGNQNTSDFTNGSHTIYLVSGSGSQKIAFDGGTPYTAVLSNISVKEVTNDIVAYYPLDGDSEVKGLSFEGTNDYIDCGTGLGTSLGDGYTGDLTFSFWIKIEQFPASGNEGIFHFI
jgi:hypothetical protein